MAIRIDEDDLIQTPPVSNTDTPPSGEGGDTTVPATEEGDSTGTEEEAGVDVNALYEDLEKQMNQRHEDEKKSLEGRYTTEVGDTDSLLKAIDEEKKAMSAKDETARKREAAYGLVAGIGDAISGFANLYGTTRNAENQPQTYASSKVAQSAEAMRRERKLDMQTLKERAKELEKQRRSLRAAYENDADEMDARHGREREGLQAARIKSAVDIYKTNLSEEGKNTRHTTPKPKSTTSSGGKTVTLNRISIGNGKAIEIPNTKWTDTTIENIYQLIPEEERTRTPKVGQFGRPVEDENGETIYLRPTKADKIADIRRLAADNEDIQKALKKIGKIVND